MKILLLDNYDSFTYNLVHLLEQIDDIELQVIRNDKISLGEVDFFDKIMLSPGPGLPSSAGIMPELIKRYGPTKSILGICLGHQAIAECFGARLYNLPKVLHGVSTKTTILDSTEKLFTNFPKTFETGHYHSWAIEQKSLPPELIITAKDDGNLIMAIRHKRFDVRGVQFHPESVLTEHGLLLVKNWVLV